MGHRTQQTLQDFYDAMLRALGPQHWWPAETALETIIGAILTQNTAWKNVERAIDNLRAAGCLDWAQLRDLDPERLAALVRPSGTYRVKAKRLRAFVAWLWERYDGDLGRMFARPTGVLREELLAISGIGRETADAILLYAGGHASFVVDAYTYRVLRRHRLIDDDADYEMIKDLFESNLPADPALFNEYHALLVDVGKKHCRARARCAGCPLEPFEHELDEPVD
jgi:endonuclease-3 related protein